ncbi:glutathione S-transferase C-terminal-like protein [Lentinus tigrinus ALCF2SS1-7]|uniref:Glutathione S-transferase C-terminal-like protein n=1 Tax=Lentinus tigrinus ALCF2SS1-6 TaxID=1328759 RepID=A0A5C2S6I1_9APHY|nr:glutathione S-transferase C-terminal-like protein [Lentinus tigrinus ALCF2SS1-6]RPD69792.1 glutathione S-transferase C-terminal-like protein [Lentinus tigrinus ALCF2SS1-7]
MSHGKQFTLYMHTTGPNGWFVAFALEELGLTYEPVYLNFQKGEQKAPAHTQYNPNGRIPTIIDHHNGDFVLWESCAILLYLVDKYDTEKRLTVTDDKKYTLFQWLFFQASGQGCVLFQVAFEIPYFGQAFWFMKWHSEKIPGAVERYQKETLRVFGVLDGVLAKSPSGYLVGDKVTIADLAFVSWNRAAVTGMVPAMEGVDVEKQFPAFYAWYQKVNARPAVKKVLDLYDQLQ